MIVLKVGTLKQVGPSGWCAQLLTEALSGPTHPPTHPTLPNAALASTESEAPLLQLLLLLLLCAHPSLVPKPAPTHWPTHPTTPSQPHCCHTCISSTS
jgi:hypothetical protein